MKQVFGFLNIQPVLFISVVSIVSYLTLPFVVQSHQTTIHKSAVETTFHSLNYAKTLALSTNKKITVTFDDKSLWCIGFSDSGLCNCKDQNACAINGEVRIISGEHFPNVRLMDIAFDGNKHAVFLSQNASSELNTTGSIVFEENKNKIKVEKKVLDRIQICSVDGNIPGYSICGVTP